MFPLALKPFFLLPDGSYGTINSGLVVWWNFLRLWKMAKKLEHICFVELSLLSIYHLMMSVGW